MKTARLIYNPTSGREEMKKRLADILDGWIRVALKPPAMQRPEKAMLC